MKKLLLLLLIILLFISCSDDDNSIKYDEIKGYLTNIESVKHGIIGVWEYMPYANEYVSFSADAIRCIGYPADNLNSCGKYEVLKKENAYVLRIYAKKDENLYSESTITTLNKQSLEYIYDGNTVKYLKQ